MTKLLRYADLKDRQIVKSRAQLKNLIEKYGFPPGRMLGPNTRVWGEETEIAAWLDSRPIAGPPPRGAAKAGKGRPRKAAPEAVAS
jgi:hypothetical protein